MSLIITTISSNGVITVTDSNTTLTSKSGPSSQLKGPDSRKCFSHPSLPVTVSFCGVCDIHGIDAEKWLDDFMKSYSGTSVKMLGGDLLLKLATQNPLPAQIFHVAGFEKLNGVAYPIFGHISSMDLVQGQYNPKPAGFDLIWDIDPPAKDAQFSSTMATVFSNGFGAGRDAFFEMHGRLTEFRRNVYSRPDWKFRPPNLHVEAEFLRMELEEIGLFFSMSDYPVPYIGGKVQIETIPWPP